jgi:hypothetical protein
VHDPDATVPQSILSLLILLTEELDDVASVTDVRDAFHELVPEETSQEDLQKNLLSFFQHPKADSWPAVRVLKVTSHPSFSSSLPLFLSSSLSLSLLFFSFFFLS